MSSGVKLQVVEGIDSRIHRWRYASKNNVQLPDEYDSIYHDLEPFWGIEPRDLLKIREELESKVDSYTVGKTSGGAVAVVKYAFKEGKYDQLIKGSEKIIDLLRDVEDFLPPFRAVFSPHDGPNRLSDYGVKSAVLEAASSRTCECIAASSHTHSNLSASC